LWEFYIKYPLKEGYIPVGNRNYCKWLMETANIVLKTFNCNGIPKKVIKPVDVMTN
jgi:hypothetical protein